MRAQNGLLFMLEKWKKCLDEKGSAGIPLIDLSKVFDCLIMIYFLQSLMPMDLITCKLNYFIVTLLNNFKE